MSKSVELSDDIYQRLVNLKTNENDTLNDIIQRLLEVSVDDQDRLYKWLVTPYTGDEETDSIEEHNVVQ